MSKEWTGERLEPFIFNINTLEHLHRYAIAVELSKGKNVLDIASGEGYGTMLISNRASFVAGVDVSEDAILRAKEKYKNDNIEFTVGSADKIPYPSAYFDLVVSFETIEHHDRHVEMLQEVKRVLKPGGVLIMSSPDKFNYSEQRNYINPFHVKELYFEEFKDLIRQHFMFSTFYFQRTMYCSAIVPEHLLIKSLKRYSGDYEKIQLQGGPFPVYNICIASDSQFKYNELSFFEGNAILTKRDRELVKVVQSSARYRLGHYIIAPFSKLRSLIYGKRGVE